jgi:hypothetical protein
MRLWEPNMFSEAMKHLGLSTPFLYAGATYGLFRYLDERISNEAKSLVTSWLKALDVDYHAIAPALLQIFDRLYTQPLLSWRAFRRSVSFSLVVSALFAIEFFIAYLGVTLSKDDDGLEGLESVLIVGIISNVIADYLSLFVIRSWLASAGDHPVRSLLLGFLNSVLLILFVILVRDYIIMIVWALINGASLLALPFELIWKYYGAYLGLYFGSGHNLAWKMALLPLCVNLWLVLLAIGLVTIRSMNLFGSGMRFVQWFLEKGRDHPLEAVGYVAAAFVFVATALMKVT